MAVDPPTETNHHTNGAYDSNDDKLQTNGHDEFSKTEKGELPTEEAPDIPQKWTFTRIIALAALCGVYVGSQMILYFVSPALNFIAITLKTDIPNWLLTANTLAVTAICPFVGYLTDLLGRRWVCMFGALCLIIGSIVLATAKNLGAGCAAMAVAGIGAGICELTALAGYVICLELLFYVSNKRAESQKSLLIAGEASLSPLSLSRSCHSCPPYYM